MKLILNNTGTIQLPVCSEDEGGWMVVVEPNKPLVIDRAGSDVIIIGDKPGMLESIQAGLKVIGKVLSSVLDIFKEEKQKVGAENLELLVSIGNNGDKPIRVIPGDPLLEGPNLQPNETIDVAAKLYIELRELGG